MKTSELTGAALDWAVVECECRMPAPFKSIPSLLNGTVRIFRPDISAHSEPISPSTNWAQGGPIIEREGITLICWNKNPDQWGARRWLELNGAPSIHVYGPTPLIAAMRCLVASKLGDTVDVPEKLK
jgi:hypothetical protein